MTATALLHPRASHRTGVVVTLLLDLLGGAPACFVAFLFAYGFEESIGLTDHVTFLVLVAAFACAMGCFGALADRSGVPGRRLWQSAAVTVPTSLSLNALAVAVGSVVSAANKDQNSVSAAFSTTTDVLVAGSLLAASVLLALVAVRAARRW